MTLAGNTALRWVVTTRTHGEVLTAGISAGELELVLLGVPAGFTPAEVVGWLHDLAGVARETSAGDARVRAIPTILHHALTGLLFSHAELWHREGESGPCSVAFLDTPAGGAFGWVGQARVQVLRDGEPFEPLWVRVRDEEGREAHAFLFADSKHIMVSLDHWPQGESDLAAPAAIEAEWSASGVENAAPASAAAAPAPLASVEPPAEAAAVRASAPPATVPAAAQAPLAQLPDSLPQEQPGLALAVQLEAATSTPAPLSEPAAAIAQQATPELEPAAESGALAPPDSAPAALSGAADAPASPDVPDAPDATDASQRASHPVGRWLSRLMSWGRKPRAQDADEAREQPTRVQDDEREFASATAESAPLYGDQPAPLSAYDSLLSSSVPPEPAEGGVIAHEQTAIAWEQGAAVPAALDEQLSADEQELLSASLASAGPLAPPSAPALAAHAPPGREVAPPAPPVAPAPALKAAAPALSPMPPLVLSVPAPSVPAALSVLDTKLPAATFASVFGAAVTPDPPALAPVVEQMPAAAVAFTAAEAASLPVLSPPVLSSDPAAPVRVDHEPVGAHETFAIPQVPVRPKAPSAPPVLRVELPREAPAARLALTPAAEPPVAAAAMARAGAAIAPAAPSAPTAPPQLRIPEAAPSAPSAPPVLRVAVPPTAPPVLNVATAPRADAPEAAFELTPSAPASATLGAVRPPVVARPAWPSADELKPGLAWYRRPWLLGSLIVVLFALGWWLGGMQGAKKDEPGLLARLARAVGLGAPRFTAAIVSDPAGAWIALDGKDMAKRTPAKLELAPGEHMVTLTLTDLGSAKFPLRGEKGQKVALEQSLNGDLEIFAADAGVPIAVAVDGKPQGYAPVKLESVAPGLHEVQFSGPGMPAWAQTVQVGVRRTAQLVAHPMAAPANGVIQAQALLNDEQGASALSGAQVFVDGELRGSTPVSLELPRGPHSLRVTWHGETAPVQVIDLPGGNQRFATFNFGLELEAPRVTLLAPQRVMPANATTLISAQLESLQPNDVRESWLHVRAPEGLWRRYPMNVMRSPSGTVVVSVFPVGAFDGQGQTRWYVSAMTQQGDEVFSEIQTATLATAHAAPATPAHAARSPKPAKPATQRP